MKKAFARRPRAVLRRPRIRARLAVGFSSGHLLAMATNSGPVVAANSC